LEGELWSPSTTLQDLDMSIAFFQTWLRKEEVEYKAAVEEIEFPYPSNLFEEIHISDGLILSSNLQELLTSIGQLSALQNLHLNHCSKLQELPTSIDQLNALQNLHLNCCSNLQELLTSIGQLNALQNLHLNRCSNLQELPRSIGQLNALQKFYLSKCSRF
jgi:hypothetical protein